MNGITYIYIRVYRMYGKDHHAPKKHDDLMI